MVRASATKEKYELFRRYQAGIHKESDEDISSMSGWKRFLVDSPFPVSVTFSLLTSSHLQQLMPCHMARTILNIDVSLSFTCLTQTKEG